MQLKLLLYSAAAAIALVAPGLASATPVTYTFAGSGITASMTFDVVGGQAISGSGSITSPFWSGSDTMTLVTLSTPGVHNLGSGDLSYRFGGGTDLIGDTAIPVDGWGPVFMVNTSPNLDVGFNLWSNGGSSYTGFLAGNALTAGGPAIYDGTDGTLSAVPEPSTWVMMILGFVGLGYAGFRARRSAISIA
jgi:hypothetical protein